MKPRRKPHTKLLATLRELLIASEPFVFDPLDCLSGVKRLRAAREAAAKWLKEGEK